MERDRSGLISISSGSGPKEECGRPRLYVTNSRTVERRWRSFIGMMKSRHSRRMRSQKAFAVCVWTGGFERANAETLQRRIDYDGEDRVAVMDHESIRMVVGKELAELLSLPSRAIRTPSPSSEPRASEHLPQ